MGFLFAESLSDWKILESIVQPMAGWASPYPLKIEIRKHSESNHIETWFYEETGGEDGPRLQRFVTVDMPILFAEWTNFLARVDRHKDKIVMKDFFSKLLGYNMATSKTTWDTRGRVMPILIYYKHSFSRRFSVRFGYFDCNLSLADSKLFLDQIIDLHKPYLPPQPEQPHASLAL